MAAYRRGLMHARRNEGLIQFRQWIAAKLQPAGEGGGSHEDEAIGHELVPSHIGASSSRGNGKGGKGDYYDLPPDAVVI